MIGHFQSVSMGDGSGGWMAYGDDGLKGDLKSSVCKVLQLTMS